MSISFQAPDQTLAQIQEAWNLRMKMSAIALRFYQHYKIWKVKTGDLYCLTREGLELFLIIDVGPTYIEFQTIVSERGEAVPGTSSALLVSEFSHGGFARNRVPVPEYVWAAATFRSELTGPSIRSLCVSAKSGG